MSIAKMEIVKVALACEGKTREGSMDECQQITEIRSAVRGTETPRIETPHAWCNAEDVFTDARRTGRRSADEILWKQIPDCGDEKLRLVGTNTLARKQATETSRMKAETFLECSAEGKHSFRTPTLQATGGQKEEKSTLPCEQ